MSIFTTGSSGHLGEGLVRVLWITEDVAPVPRNIYGATKTAAEDLCELARRELGWAPRYGFGYALACLRAGEEPRSALAVAVGAKRYRAVSTGPYTVR